MIPFLVRLTWCADGAYHEFVQSCCCPRHAAATALYEMGRRQLLRHGQEYRVVVSPLRPPPPESAPSHVTVH